MLMNTANSTNEKKDVASALFLAYRHYVKAIALQFAPHPQIADEIVQQVYTDFLRWIENNSYPDHPKAYLAEMARNTAKKAWKNEAKHLSGNVQLIAEHITQLARQDDPDQYSEELAALESCLEKAPKKSRELIEMHYFGGVSMKEISRKMGVQADTTYQAFFRLREKLKKCIDNTLLGEKHHVGSFE